MFKKVSSTAVIISAMVLLIGCQSNVQENQTPPPTVIVATVTTEDVAPRETFIGVVDAASRATITARVNGYLEKRLVNEGDMVRKDQLILTIERSQYVAAVNQAEAALAQARANAYNARLQKERAEALLKSASISQAQYDNLNAADAVAQANVAAARAALDAAQLNLEYTSVTSPIAGKMGFINFNIGEIVGPSSGPLTTIIASDPMYVIFTVTDRQIQSVRQTFNALNMDFYELASKLVDLKITLSDGSEYLHTGVVNFTDNTLVAATDALRLRGVFANPDDILTQGQTVTVSMVGREKINSIILSQSSILNDIGGKYVLMADSEGNITRRDVVVGAQVAGGRQVITSGLNAGDTIVISGLQKVRNGAKANAVTQAEYDRMMASPPAQGAPENDGGK